MGWYEFLPNNDGRLRRKRAKGGMMSGYQLVSTVWIQLPSRHCPLRGTHSELFHPKRTSTYSDLKLLAKILDRLREFSTWKVGKIRQVGRMTGSGMGCNRVGTSGSSECTLIRQRSFRTSSRTKNSSASGSTRGGIGLWTASVRFHVRSAHHLSKMPPPTLPKSMLIISQSNLQRL